MPHEQHPQTNASAATTFLLDQPAVRGAFGVPEAQRLREGVQVFVNAANGASEGDYRFLVDVQGKGDGIALYASGLAPQSALPPTFPIALEWQLIAGTECGLDYDAPLFQGVTTFTSADDIRTGLLVSARGQTATRWTLWGRWLNSPDAPQYIFEVSGAVTQSAGADLFVTTGSVIG